MPLPAPFRFAQAQEDDFERLLDIRLLAMRESLERIGRYDPARARQRFRGSFAAENTRLIYANDDTLVGCVALTARGDHLWLEHFYILPNAQGQGLGQAVLRQVLAEADQASLSVKLDVVRESAAKRLYDRHGFVETHRDAVDIFMQRQPTVSTRQRGS